MKRVMVQLFYACVAFCLVGQGAQSQTYCDYGYYYYDSYLQLYSPHSYMGATKVTAGKDLSVYYYCGFCLGDILAVQISPDGVKWITIASGKQTCGSYTINATVPLTTTPGNYYLRITTEPYYGTCYLTPSYMSYSTNKYLNTSYYITVERGCVDPPITKQPADQKLCLGDKLFIDVDAPTGPYYSYKWYRNGTLISTSGPDLLIPSATLSDAGNYSLVVDDVCGKTSTSSTAKIEVREFTAITTPPQPTIICKGTGGQLSVVAKGDKLSYQWYKDGVAMTGQTASTLKFFSAIPSDMGYYHVRVSGECGPPVNSTPVLLTIPPKAEITKQPEPVSACPGSVLQLTITATGGYTSYQWLHNDKPIVGATQATLSIPGATTANNGFYRCIVDIPGVKDATGCDASVISNQVYANVYAAPVIQKQPEMADVCSGSDVQLVVGAEGTGLMYQWYRNDAAIPNATNFSLNMQDVTVGQSGTYYAVVTGVCGLTATTVPVEVGIHTMPTIEDQPQSVSILMGEDATLEVGATDAQVITWMQNEKERMTGRSTSFTIADAKPSDAGYYRAVIKNACGGVVSRLAKVTVIDPASLEPRLATNTNMLDVGEVPFGYSGQRSFTGVITNNGNVPVNITGATTTGADAGSFVTAVSVAPTTLQPGENLSVQVSFTPSRVGQSTARIAIESDATNGPHEFDVVGLGVIRYTVNGDLAFGVVDKQSTNTKCFQINNTSTMDIVIDQVDLSGTSAPSFSVSTPTPLSVAAGSTKELCLQFSPTDVGAYSATVSFKSSTGGNLDAATTGTCEIASTVTVDALEAGILAFPNPAASTLTVTTGSVTPTSIQVISNTGQLVATLPAQQQVTWNLTSADGVAVSSGTYTLLIMDEHSIYRMMVQVVR